MVTVDLGRFSRGFEMGVGGSNNCTLGRTGTSTGCGLGSGTATGIGESFSSYRTSGFASGRGSARRGEGAGETGEGLCSTVTGLSFCSTGGGTGFRVIGLGTTKLVDGRRGGTKLVIAGFFFSSAKDFSLPIRAISPQSIVFDVSSLGPGGGALGCCAGLRISMAMAGRGPSNLAVNRRSRAVSPVETGLRGLTTTGTSGAVACGVMADFCIGDLGKVGAALGEEFRGDTKLGSFRDAGGGRGRPFPESRFSEAAWGSGDADLRLAGLAFRLAPSSLVLLGSSSGALSISHMLALSASSSAAILSKSCTCAFPAIPSTSPFHSTSDRGEGTGRGLSTSCLISILAGGGSIGKGLARAPGNRRPVGETERVRDDMRRCSEIRDARAPLPSTGSVLTFSGSWVDMTRATTGEGGAPAPEGKSTPTWWI